MYECAMRISDGLTGFDITTTVSPRAAMSCDSEKTVKFGLDLVQFYSY